MMKCKETTAKKGEWIMRRLMKKMVCVLIMALFVSCFVSATIGEAAGVAKVRGLKKQSAKGYYRGWKNTRAKKMSRIRYQKGYRITWKKVKKADGYEVFRYARASKQWNKIRTVKTRYTKIIPNRIVPIFKCPFRLYFWRLTTSVFFFFPAKNQASKSIRILTGTVPHHSDNHSTYPDTCLPLPSSAAVRPSASTSCIPSYRTPHLSQEFLKTFVLLPRFPESVQET